MTTESNIPAGWYADPSGTPQQLRYWDGTRWTEHTHPAPPQTPAPAQQQPAQQPPVQQPYAGQQPYPQQQPAQPQVPPQQPYAQQQVPQQQPQQAPHQPPKEKESFFEVNVDYASTKSAGAVQRQVQRAGVGAAGPGGGTLFTEPVLVVNQKAKMVELNNEYRVFDQHGRQLGSVVQVGQNVAQKAVRLFTNLDKHMSVKLEVRDAQGQPQLLLHRPTKLIKSRVVVQRPDGSTLGEIVQKNAIGKINFAFEVDGQPIGAIKGENWRAWNFAIVDHTESEVARITKTWEGSANQIFTTADNYVLKIHRQLPDPLLSLVVASALTVDTALKQDEPDR